MRIVGFVTDLRYASRVLVKNKSFTLLVVLTLGIGIGASVALFSVVNAVLQRPLPYGESDRLVKVWETRARVPKGRVSWADYVDWKAQAKAFDGIAAYRTGDYNLTGNGDPEQLQGASLSFGLFNLLRVSPQFGRAFTAEDDRPGVHKIVILSNGLWQRRFGADPRLIGQIIRIDDEPFEVVGIMPPGFVFPDPKIELWVPLAMNPNSRMAGRTMHILDVIGRLRTGATLDGARAEMHTVAARLEREYPRENTGHGADVFALLDDWTGAYRTSLMLIFGAVIFVLLIACANVATLLLSRATERRKEVAIRCALGARRERIISQLLSESVMLAGLGAALGLMVAYGLIKTIILVTPVPIPRIAESGLSWSVWAFTLGITFFSGVLLGIVPAFHVSNLGTAEVLKDTSINATAGAQARRLRGIFVVAEVSLAAMLLTGAGLLLKSFLKIESVDPGFNAVNVLTANVSLQSFRPQQRQAFVGEVLDRLRLERGVTAAGAVTHLPLTGAGPSFDFQIAGRPQAAPGEESKAQLRCATPDYFRALGIVLLSGRSFTVDDAGDAVNVVVINDAMARRYWPGQSPLGQKISFDQTPDGAPVWREIVGMVRGVRHSSLESEPEPQMYTPFSQFSMPFAAIAVRTSGDPLALSRTLRSAVASVNPREPVSSIQTMRQVVEQSIASRRFNVLMIAFFAAVAVLVAAIGVYGILSYSVTQRRHEIGVRLALGCGPQRMMWMIMKDGISLVALGICLGGLGAWSVMRLLSALLYNVSASDPIVLSCIAALLLGVAALASYVPAWRAARVDPATALRTE